MESTAIHGGSLFFSRVLSHKTIFFFYFAFTAESLRFTAQMLETAGFFLYTKNVSCHPSCFTEC